MSLIDDLSGAVPEDFSELMAGQVSFDRISFTGSFIILDDGGDYKEFADLLAEKLKGHYNVETAFPCRKNIAIILKKVARKKRSKTLMRWLKETK